MYFYVYKITNLINGSYYIGCRQSNLPPLEDYKYMGSSKYLKEDLRKYGYNSFEKEIIYKGTTKKDILNKERELVQLEQIKDPLCYNIQYGGCGYKLNPDEWREFLKKLRESNPKKYEQSKIQAEKTRQLYLTTERGKALRKKYAINLGYGYDNRMNQRFYDVYKKYEKNFIFLLGMGLALIDIKKFLKTPVKILNYKKYLILKKGIDFELISGKGGKFYRQKNINNREYNEIYMNYLTLYKDYLFDIKYSDSWFKSFLNINMTGAFKYYQDIGIMDNKIKVNIKNIFPNAQRATGQKTLLKIDNLLKRQYYKIEGDYVYEYIPNITYDDTGKFISILWSKLERFKREPVD